MGKVIRFPIRRQAARQLTILGAFAELQQAERVQARAFAAVMIASVLVTLILRLVVS